MKEIWGEDGVHSMQSHSSPLSPTCKRWEEEKLSSPQTLLLIATVVHNWAIPRTGQKSLKC